MQIFTTQREDINGRLDCYYYQPEFVELQKTIKKKTNKTLGDFVLGIAGGATPNKLYSDKYYAKSADDGIPFLRVQNVTNEGLNFENLKFIKEETHQGLLKRSQVKEGYLITKITGVGRMAVSSVVPKDFEGNINQHLVAIKTESREISEALANFLNSDIGERLASRRSTGGTRPALDYKALLSIPVILNSKITSVMQSAYKDREKKLKQADELLNSVDGYVRQQLGIDYKEPEEKSTFTTSSDEVESKRLDPKKYSQKPKAILTAIKRAKYSQLPLNNLIVTNLSGEWGNDLFDKDTKENNNTVQVKVLRNTNFDNSLNLNLDDVAERLINKSKFEKIKLQDGDILVEKSGGSPIQPVGRVAIFDNIQGDYCFSNFLQCIKINTTRCLPYYLFVYLKAIYGLNYMEYLQNQTTGIKNLIWEEFTETPVVLPSKDIQEKLAEEVKNRMTKTIALRHEASIVLKEAKKQVEQMILL